MADGKYNGLGCLQTVDKEIGKFILTGQFKDGLQHGFGKMEKWEVIGYEKVLYIGEFD